MKNLSMCAVTASVMLVTMWACKKDNVDDLPQSDFMRQSVYGVYVDGKVGFVYDEEECQLAFNASRRTSRIQKDDMSVYVSFGLSTSPEVNNTVYVNVIALNVDGVNDGKMDMKVVKVESEHVWLWNKKQSIGYLIYWE